MALPMQKTRLDGGKGGMAGNRLAGSTSRRSRENTASDEMIARRNWARYEELKQRGHTKWALRAALLEGMYLGGGEQWRPDDAAALEEEGRHPVELNEVFDSINSALGNQIQNRVDIGFRARNRGATDQTAEILSKVGMQIADNNAFRHKETQVTADGFITGRGYFEMRVDYTDSLTGEIVINAMDPADVLPDDAGKDYDPDTWQDVTITRWLTLDEIEVFYGRAAREKVEMSIDGTGGDSDFGNDEGDGVRRNKFGMEEGEGGEYNGVEASDDEDEVVRVRIIDRQHWQMAATDVVLFPSGDIREIEGATPAQIAAANADGAINFRRPMRRVRWTVSTYGNVLLHDDWSPYKHFTVVPYFPYFRRGKTRGLVDNAVGPQEMLNKAASQFIHIINTMANSGWTVEQNSLTNMSVDDLEEEGAKTGLIIEYKKGATRPEKITPNQVPSGIDRLMELSSAKIRTITGITDAFRGQSMSANQSGRAVQALQYGSQLALSVPLDNLARTRHMVAARMLSLIQRFMDMPQVMRIIRSEADGSDTTEDLYLNWEGAGGEVINDLTLGEYSVVVTEKPNAVTFEQTQHDQAMAMKEKGAPIPWSFIVRHSSLSNRNELATEMASAEKGDGNPEAKANAALAQAKAATEQAKAVTESMEALFSAMRASQLLRSDPALAGLADKMLASGGFQDKTPADPVVPSAAGMPPGAPPPNSTNPLTPDNPGAGVTAGMGAVAQ